MDAIRHLIPLMLKSMGDVPSGLRGAYVLGADKIKVRKVLVRKF